MTTQTTKPSLEVRITKSLLGYGVIAGPIYILVVLGQALTRRGFDPTRHPASVLVNGELGWIQIANFLVTGAMTIAAAVGIYRATRPGRTSARAAWLLGGYGAGLIVAGVFRADPVPGFPPGTPDDITISWHGVAHFASGAAGFACLTAACFVLAVWFSRRGEHRWAWYSRVTAVLFAIGFGAITAGSGAPATVLMFTAAVILGWSWITAVSLHLYRAAPGCAGA
jgi:Protein of unknown function (DUF998)